ncbi:MAG: helix-turn-helix transcriptional regulator [Burkholderiales bacterium]
MVVCRYELARALAAFEHARKSRRRKPALLKDRVYQMLIADLVAARTAAGMTQDEVAQRMWTRKSAVSRLESGRYARPTLDTIQKYALAVGARVEIRVRYRP